MSNPGKDLKIALVTGSTRGIGLVTALKLKKCGYLVIANSRKKFGMLSAAFQKFVESDCRMDYIAGDVTEEAAVEKIFNNIKEKYARIDVLVNNAGYSEQKSFIRLTKANVTDMIYGNLISAMICSKYAIRCMMQQKSGRIINISSTAALHGMPFETHYSAAKAGMIGLSKSIAKEYGTKGITCNVVAPGVINKNDLIHKKSSEEEILAKIPLRRKGELEEVAALIVFLVSEKASYITGQVIQMDGGLFL